MKPEPGKKWFSRILFKYPLLTTLLLFLVLLFLFVDGYFRERKSLLGQSLNQGKFLIQTYGPLTAKAIQFKDDLALITYLQNLMEQSSVLYALVLSPQGEILAHHQPSEIGKAYNDPLTQRALTASGLQILRLTSGEYPQDEPYDFSLPLMVQGTKKAVLRLGVSTREVKTSLSRYVENRLLISLAALLVGLAGSYFLAYWLTQPLGQVKETIEAIARRGFGKLTPELGPKGDLSETPNISRGDELGELISVAKEAAKKIAEERKKFEEEISSRERKSQLYLKNLAEQWKGGILLADGNNRLIYLNELGKKAIFANEEPLFGKHILEVARNIEFINLLKKATNNPNQIISEELKNANQKLKILCMEDEQKNLIGTIALTD